MQMEQGIIIEKPKTWLKYIAAWNFGKVSQNTDSIDP